MVNGIGGLGSYGVQYAKLLGAGATVIAFARSDDKLAVARDNGADHTVNVRGKSVEDVQNELEDLTNRRDVDAVLDCAGSPDSLGAGRCRTRHRRRTVSGRADGNEGGTPAVPLRQWRTVLLRVLLGGNHNDLQEVLALASQGKIKHNVVTVKLDDVNDNLEALGRGDIVGRAVIVFD